MLQSPWNLGPVNGNFLVLQLFKSRLDAIYFVLERPQAWVYMTEWVGDCGWNKVQMYNLVQPILTRKLIFHCNCHLHLFWIINKKVKGQYGRIMHMQSMTDAKCQMLMYWYMFCLPIMMDRCNVGNIRATYNEFINFTFVHDKRTKHRGHLVATGLSNVHNLSLSFQMFIWNNCGAERAFFVIIKLIRSR